MKNRKPRPAAGQDATDKARHAAAKEIEARIDAPDAPRPDVELCEAPPRRKGLANATKIKAIAAATSKKARVPKPAGSAKTRKADKAPKGNADRPKRDPKPKRRSGLDYAAEVLASAKEPLGAQAIAERVLAAGWTTSGKTPHATLYAAMIREIDAKGKDARFRKTDRGLFASSGKGA